MRRPSSAPTPRSAPAAKAQRCPQVANRRLESLESLPCIVGRDPCVRIQRFGLDPQCFDSLRGTAPFGDARLQFRISCAQPNQLFASDDLLSRRRRQFDSFFGIRVGQLLKRFGHLHFENFFDVSVFGNPRNGRNPFQFRLRFRFRFRFRLPFQFRVGFPLRFRSRFGIASRLRFRVRFPLRLRFPFTGNVRLRRATSRGPLALRAIAASSAIPRVVDLRGRGLRFENLWPVEFDIGIVFFDPSDGVFVERGAADFDVRRRAEPIKQTVSPPPLTTDGVDERCRFVPAFVAGEPQKWQGYLRLGDFPAFFAGLAAAFRGAGFRVLAAFFVPACLVDGGFALGEAARPSAGAL